MQCRPFESLPSGAVLRSLDQEISLGRRNAAKVLALITEVEIRKLFADGYSSLWDFCTRRLHLSENEASNRIHASRAARRFPIILEMIADGRLHMTGVRLLRPHLTPETANSLLRASIHKSRKEIEQLIADRFPRPDVATQMLAIPQTPTVSAAKVLPVLGTVKIPSNFEVFESGPSDQAVHTPDPGSDQTPIPAVAQSPAPSRVEPAAGEKITPLGAQRYEIRGMFQQTTLDKMRRLEDLLGRRITAGDLNALCDFAFAAGIEKLEKRKFAATDKPRVGKPSSNPRHIPARVKRAVEKRDGGRCAYVGDDGRRCEERRNLEFDHVIPVAKGGESTVANVRQLCRTHNQLEAERAYGYAFMEGKREVAAEARESAHALRPPA
jgi:5-methylcytosine-specific restriction endonuclease McrA